MTLEDAIKETGLEIIPVIYYVMGEEESKGIPSMITGMCSYSKGTLYPLDGDLYYLDDIIKKYEIQTDRDNNNVMFVTLDGEWVNLDNTDLTI